MVLSKVYTCSVFKGSIALSENCLFLFVFAWLGNNSTLEVFGFA